MTKSRRFMLLALLVLPSLASAQYSIGLRAGYAVPGGDLQKNTKLKDQLTSQVPIQLDLMYKATPALSVGVYGSYGFDQVAGTLKDNTTMLVGPGASYSASTTRVGLQATYAFTGMAVIPWVGLGSGLEMGNFEVKNGPAKITGATRGWEIADLQVGADYAVTESFGAGLFASYSIGRFTYQGGKASGTGFADGETGGGLGSDAANHSWFTVGLRGTFGR